MDNVNASAEPLLNLSPNDSCNKFNDVKEESENASSVVTM